MQFNDDHACAWARGGRGGHRDGLNRDAHVNRGVQEPLTAPNLIFL